AESGGAGLCAHRRVFRQVERKSGPVGCSAAVVRHPQRGPAKIPARPQTNPASTPPARLTPPAIVANWYANCRPAWRQLPDLGSKAPPSAPGPRLQRPTGCRTRNRLSPDELPDPKSIISGRIAGPEIDYLRANCRIRNRLSPGDKVPSRGGGVGSPGIQLSRLSDGRAVAGLA